MLQESSLKTRLRNGERVLGTWNSIPSAPLVNAIGLSGLDFIVIDAEHGPVSMETAEDLVRAAEVTGLTSLIRVPTNEAHQILRALDIGAGGVQVPHVSTAAEARQVVAAAKYAPQGQRGYSPFTRAGRYGLGAKDHARIQNERTVVVLNIEGTEGIKNLGDIVKVDGVDVVFIGPYDLSQSLGKPGQVDHPDVLAAIRESVGLVEGHGLACGSFARDKDYLDLLVDCGVRYLTYQVDANFIMQGYKDLQETFAKKGT